MKVEFNVRQACEEDLRAVVALERSIPTAAHWAEVEYMAIVRGGIIGSVRRTLLIAERFEAGRPVDLIGFAVGKVLKSEVDSLGELESVVVVEKVRRAGVGKSLCNGILKWCAEEGTANIELEVRSANAAAIALYRQIGFVLEGMRPRYYYDPPDDALLMRFKAPSEI